MISVVFSTREKNEKYISHIKKTVGVKDVDIIQIENAGVYSLTEAYNIGLSKSKYDIVAFIHDDLILPDNWGKKMLNHFNNSDYGILGVAGTTDLLENGQWWSDTTKMVGIVKHSHNGKTWENKYSASFGKDIIETVIVDGLFFVVDKTKIKNTFSEDVKGFHFYDIDFTFNNHINGVKVGVVFDVRVIHKSIGQTNQEWENNRIKFVEKYKDRLPHKLKGVIKLPENKITLNKTPKVAVIIPNKSNNELLFKCITSIIEKDGYHNLEIFIADTGSTDDEKKEIKKLILTHQKTTVINLVEYNYYNFAKINNDVVKNYIGDDSEILLFCNNDIELINDAITRMVNVYNKNIKNVGTIGARLYFGDNTIQHSGIIALMLQNSNKLSPMVTHYGLNSIYKYYTDNQNVLGCTAAFLMINKKLFFNVGGFNEEYLECFEDVHLNIDCLKMGKKNIFCSDSVCYHLESQTRKKDDLKLKRETQDFTQRIIPYILKNNVTYDYFINIKRKDLENILKNGTIN